MPNVRDQILAEAQARRDVEYPSSAIVRAALDADRDRKRLEARAARSSDALPGA